MLKMKAVKDDEHQCTSMPWAVEIGREAGVKLLLDQGATADLTLPRRAIEGKRGEIGPRSHVSLQKYAALGRTLARARRRGVNGCSIQ
jgi:hypothetical protein